MVFQQLQGVVLHGGWLILGLCICLNCLDHFHSFLRVDLRCLFVEYFYLPLL